MKSLSHMDLKTVIFDFDGTLADTIDIVVAVCNRLATANKLHNITKEAILEMGLVHMLKNLKINPLKLLLLSLKAKKLCGQQLHTATTFENMHLTLGELKNMGVDLGILTSNSKKNVNTFLTMQQMSKYFSFVYAENNLAGKAKVLHKILKDRKLAPHNVIYVCDEPSDIAACKECAIPSVAVTWGFTSEHKLREAAPDFVAYKSPDLVKIVGYILAL